jgi:transposase-like protein
VGVSKSSISEKAIEASTAQLKEPLGRRWEETELLMIYIDVMQFGTHHVISAVGVDGKGVKHVLGIQQGGRRRTRRP